MDEREGKGASGLHEATSFTRCGGVGLGRTGLDPRSPRVTQRADTDGHCVLSGARPRAPPHIVRGARESATKRQRYAGASPRRRNAPRRLAGPPKRALGVKPRVPGSRGTRHGVSRDDGEPVFGNGIVGSRRRSKGDRGYRCIRAHSDVEASSRAARTIQKDGEQGDLARRASSRVKHAEGERGTTVGSGRFDAGASESESGARSRRSTSGWRLIFG